MGFWRSSFQFTSKIRDFTVCSTTNFEANVFWTVSKRSDCDSLKYVLY